MKIEKLSSSSNVEFIAPVTKNFANVPPVVDDTTSRSLRYDPQLKALLGHDTILEIRKISDNEYHIITNGGHQIPIEIVFAPYPYAYRFQSLSWDRGVYNMYSSW